MPRGVAKTYAPLDVSVLDSFTSVTDDEKTALAPAGPTGIRQPKERSELLVKLDERNAFLYGEYVKAGKPKNWDDAPAVSIGKVAVAGTAEAVSMKVLIQGSARFLDRGYQFGKDGETKDGRSIVSWRITDKRERKAKANGNASE